VAPQLTHFEIQELLGAYALDALDGEEAAAVDAHLLDCPRCRTEVSEHREAASLLSFSGTAAPDAVWSRIASDLDETPPPLELARPIPIRPSRAPVRIFAAVAAAAAVVIGVLGVRVVQQDRRIDRLAAAADQGGLDQAAAAAAVAPGSRTVRLQSADRAHGADAVVLADGQGYLVRAQLPELGPGQTYQLWGVMGSETISLGVLGDKPTVTPFKAAGPLTALAISAERTGGAVSPTTAPIVQARVGTG
jgi:hypothetical protein